MSRADVLRLRVEYGGSLQEALDERLAPEGRGGTGGSDPCSAPAYVRAYCRYFSSAACQKSRVSPVAVTQPVT
jgi:hypothetical protein